MDLLPAILIQALRLTLYVIEILIFLRVILSWIRLDTRNRFIDLVDTLTEPILAPIRYLISKSIFAGRKGGMLLDISPLIAFIIIQVLLDYLGRF